MKIHLVSRLWRAVLSLFFLFSAAVQATPPDLTVAGAITTLKGSTTASPLYSQTYNLGATGLRGWISIDNSGGNVGQDDLMTDQSRQILVTVASAPGNAVLAVDDVILGAMAGSSGTVPLFSSDCRKAFGAAITAAEATGAGTLRVKCWRAGTTTDVNIPMTIMGNYTDTAPYSCPKSALVLANARDQLVSQLYANSGFLSSDWAGAINGLALMASVQPGYVHPTLPSATYAYVQTRLQTFARSLASTTPQQTSLFVWDWGYLGVFLSEYYLRTVADGTPDTNVVAGLNTRTVALAQVQSRYGTYGHGGALLNADGSWHGTVGPYGPVNQTGIVANIAIVMGKKALLAASQTIDPEIDPAILRGSNFFAWYVNKGPIPYGEHEPFIAGHSPNGKDASCAVLFGLQDTRTTETQYFSRMSTAGYLGREYGHTGQGFSYLWGAMGANMGGAAAVAAYLKPVRWHLDLERRTDGTFVYDGGEQYGAGSTADGSYLGASSYNGLNPTASYILTYGLPLQRLYITGRNANPANTLDSATVASAVAAGTYDIDCPGFTTAQLITDLSNFDPCVRHYAAAQLGSRSLASSDLTTLRTMVGDMTNANGRQGACEALGLLKDATALPIITQHLDKTVEPDSWVRAKAASAIRNYTSAAASAELTPMLTAFTANATDPDVIAWDDPIQISNGYLGFALFGDAVYGGGNIASYTIGASKSLLYPAVQTGLKQPDSKSRFGTANFCYNYLTLADVQALFPDLIQVIETESQADTMWSMNPRGSGIATLAKYKIAEGISEALNMLVVPTGFGWGSDGFQVPGLNALAAYGDAARWTLPTLQGYLGTWDPSSTQYTTLVSTIASIQAAITSPTENLGLAVANSQVVATTGAKAITLTGSSPRGAVSFTNVTAPAHGTLTGTAPNLTYTPNAGFTGPDAFTFQVTDSLTTSAPGTVSVIVGTAGNGLKGEYYDNINFTNLKVTRIDPQVNFNWGSSAPDASMGAGTFSVRWSGLLLVPETGTYKFSTLNSDGVRLYINGVLVINDYTDQTTNWTDGASVNLTAGQMADIQMEYYDNADPAVAKLKWTGPSFAGANGTLIGTQWLYDGTGFTRTPYAHDQSLTLVQNTPQPITLTGSGGTLGYVILTQPAHGTLTGTAPNLTYTPAANYNGSDSFTFLVNNGASNSTPATVSLSIWAGQPVSYTWAGATTGNWSTGANWTGSAAPAAAGQPYYSLNFTPSGTYTVTQDLNNGFVLNQLNLGGAVTVAGSNSIAFAANGTLLPQLNQTSANAVTLNTPLVLNAMTDCGGSGSGQVNLAGLVSGAGGLIKDNPGMLKLYGYNLSTHTVVPNTYSGGTVINTGTVHLGTMDGSVSYLCANPAGTGTITLNGGTIEFDRVTASNPLTLNGGTLYSSNGWGATWSGAVALNGTATINATWNFTFSGSVSGAGGFIKTGSSTMTLSGSNSYTGANSVTAGTLSCSNANALGTGSLDITTGAIVNLNYSGTRVISALTFNAGYPMVPGTYGSSSSPAANKNDSYFTGTGTVTILPATTTTLALTGGTTPADPGTPLTFTATVTGSSPTGGVAFYAGSTLLGTGTLNASYQATLTTSSLAIGSYSITAKYAGNATNATSTSAPLAIVIASKLASSPVNLLAAPGNNHIALSWTASSGATSYYVKRSSVNGGPYTVIGNPSTAGYDDLTAINGTTYYYVVSAINSVGESANSSQISAVPAIQVSTTAVASSLGATGPYGSAVTFTATVTVSGALPTGTVTFKDGATVIGTGTLDGTGTATLATSALAVASHSVTATYAGDANYAASVSAPYVYGVTPLTLTVTGVTASNKVYDGGNAAALTGGALGGVINGETVTIVAGSGTFASPNAGTWAVTANGYTLGGANAGNYVLGSQPVVANATIAPLPVQLGGNGTRVYDATTVVSAANLTIANKVSGDDLGLTGTATLAGKDAGSQGFLSVFGTPARVQKSSGTTTTASLAVTLTSNPTNGNTLVAVISTRGTTAGRISGITGGGVTWSRVVQATNASGATTEIWYGPNVANGTTGISITQAAALRAAAVVIEYSGVLTASALDQSNSTTGTSATAATGTTAATTQANELWLGGIGIADGRRTLGTPTNSFTVVASPNSGAASADAMVYALEKIVTATGAASSGGTLSASDSWAGTIATFKAAPVLNLALTGASAANYTLSGITGAVTVLPKPLVLTATPAVSAKAYDGQTAATLTGAALAGAEAAGAGTTGDGKPYTGDTVTLALSGTFDTKDVGSGKAVTSTSTLGGAQAGDYTLTQPTGLTGTINPKALVLTANPAVTAKTYDGLTAATLTGAALQATETAGAGTTGDGKPYSGDAVTLMLSGAFNTKDAGTGKAVTSTSTLGGAQAGDYTLTQPTGLTGTITPKALVLTATPAVTAKTYDGLTAATLTGATLQAAEAAGAGSTGDGKPYSGDTVTLTMGGTFDTKDVGGGKAVTSTSTLGGAQAGDYTLTQPTGLTGGITPKALVLTATPAVAAKTYDGLTSATLTGTTLQAAEAAGLGTTSDGKPYTGDTVTLTLSGTFDTQDVGSGKAVTSTSALGGAQAGDYTLTQPTGLTGAVMAAGLTVTANNQGKSYGQSLVFGSGATQFTSSGLQNGETIGSVTLACAGGDPAAAAGIYPITPGAATGGTFSAANYTISYVAGTLTVTSAYQSWSGGAAFDADPNHRGVANGLAWLLGAADPSADASAVLPKPANEGGKLVLAFRCLKSANRGAAVLKVQFSNDLSQPDPWTTHEVVVPDAGGTSGGVDFTITPDADPAFINVRAAIPAGTASTTGALFARLNATGD